MNPVRFSLLLTAFASLLAPVPAQAQEWVWAHRAGASTSDAGSGVAVDGAGNAYVTGSFQGTADFGAFTLTSERESYDVFVAKYSAEGDALWARSVGGPNLDSGGEIAVDAAGNAYVTGNFRGTASVEDFTLTSADTSVLSYDAFVAKYSPDGEVLWARRAGGIGFDYGASIAVDGAGNAYAAGQFMGTADFGGFTLTAAGILDAFVAKYSPEGEVLWAERAGGTTAVEDGANGIAVDGYGNAYVVGFFSGTADVGAFTLTSVGAHDVFVAKYSPEGEVLWAVRSGGPAAEYGMDIAVDFLGNSFAVGRFQGTAVFGEFILTGRGPDELGAFDVFVAKYGPFGEVLWAKRAGGTDNDIGRALAVDREGSAYLTGSFLETADFGDLSVASDGESDAFFAKYSWQGEVLWAERMGGTNIDFGMGIAVDDAGNAYVTGGFASTAAFGASAVTSAGDGDVFVARLGTTPTATEPGSAIGARAIGAYPSPASGSTTATFRLDRPGPIRLTLYDVLGREVIVVAEGARAAGEHAATFDTSRLSPGLYVLRLQAGGSAVTHTLTVVR